MSFVRFLRAEWIFVTLFAIALALLGWIAYLEARNTCTKATIVLGEIDKFMCREMGWKYDDRSFTITLPEAK